MEIWVASSEEEAGDGEFIHWTDISLKGRAGTQMFAIDSIPESFRIVKVIITETYGEFQTYLNQLCLLAEPDYAHTSQSLFNQEDWN